MIQKKNEKERKETKKRKKEKKERKRGSTFSKSEGLGGVNSMEVLDSAQAVDRCPHFLWNLLRHMCS